MTSEPLNMPGFAAEESLGRSRVHYRTQTAGAAIGLGFVQPQILKYPKKGKCWCSEPDTKSVCTSPGVCHDVPVCLQYSCPGTSVDLDDPGDYFENGLTQTVNYPKGN